MFTFLFLICSEAWHRVLLLQTYWELLKEVLMISITIYSGWFKYVIFFKKREKLLGDKLKEKAIMKQQLGWGFREG